MQGLRRQECLCSIYAGTSSDFTESRSVETSSRSSTKSIGNRWTGDPFIAVCNYGFSETPS